MKKTLAIILSVLLIFISIAPMSFAVTPPTITPRVIEGAYDESATAVTTVKNGTFTVIFKCAAVTKLTDAAFHLSFDKAVLKVLKAGACGIIDADKNEVTRFSGVWESGLRSNGNEYAFGFINSSGVDKSAATDMFYATFQLLDNSQTAATIKLYTDAFHTNNGDDKDEISASTLTQAVNVALQVEGENPSVDTSSESETTPATADDINDLIAILRDMLAGNGATFEDFMDALVNVFGNADIMDMIGQLVDGDFNISDAFQDILGNLNIDFGSFEDILNKIIDFFKGLFGGDDTTKTTSVITTGEAGPDSSDTTSSGSSSGSEKTGDAGIAIAATVCVAAAAAFALTRKKKETV